MAETVADIVAGVRARRASTEARAIVDQVRARRQSVAPVASVATQPTIQPSADPAMEALRLADWDAVRERMPIKRPKHMQEPSASMYDPGQGRGSPAVAETLADTATGLAKSAGPPMIGTALGAPLGVPGMAIGGGIGSLVSALWGQAESGQEMLRGQGIPQPTLAQGMIEMAEEHPVASPASAALETLGGAASAGIGAKLSAAGMAPAKQAVRNMAVAANDAVVNGAMQTYLNDPDPTAKEAARNILLRAAMSMSLEGLGAFMAGGKPDLGPSPEMPVKPARTPVEPPAPKVAPEMPSVKPEPEIEPDAPIGFDETPPVKKGVVTDEVPQKGQEVLEADQQPPTLQPGPSKPDAEAAPVIKGEWADAVDVMPKPIIRGSGQKPVVDAPAGAGMTQQPSLFKPSREQGYEPPAPEPKPEIPGREKIPDMFIQGERVPVTEKPEQKTKVPVRKKKQPLPLGDKGTYRTPAGALEVYTDRGRKRMDIDERLIHGELQNFWDSLSPLQRNKYFRVRKEGQPRVSGKSLGDFGLWLHSMGHRIGDSAEARGVDEMETAALLDSMTGNSRFLRPDMEEIETTARMERDYEEYAWQQENEPYIKQQEAQEEARAWTEEENLAHLQAKIREIIDGHGPLETHGFGLGKAGRKIERAAVGVATDAAKPFFRPRRVLEKTPEGSDVVALADTVETTRRMRHGKTASAIEKSTEKLNWSDKNWMRKNFKEAFESGSAMPNPRIQAWADTFRGVTNEYGELGEKLGVLIRDPSAAKGKPSDDMPVSGRDGWRPFYRSIENFFPRQWTEEALTALREGHGELFDAIQREVGDVELDPIGVMDVGGIRRKYGSTEMARTIFDPPERIMVNGEEIKIVEDDPFKMIESYMDRASRNLTVIEHFGQFGEKLSPEAIGNYLTKTAGSDAARQWENIWKEMNAEYQHDPVRNLGRMGDAVTAAEQIARTGQLSLSTVSNVGGYMPIAVRYGAGTAAKNYARSIASYAGDLVGIKTKAGLEIDAARSHDAWRNDVLQNNYQVEDFKGLTGKVGKTAMKLTLFNRINRHIQKVASLASRDALEQWVALAGGGKTGSLRKLWGMDSAGARASLKREFGFTDSQIDKMIKSGIAEKDYAQTVQRAAANINVYAESPLERPRWMSHPVSRRIMSYTSYARAQGNQLADSLVAFKSGNVRPLVTTILGYAPVGIALNALRDWLYDREKKDKDFLAKVGAGYMQMATLGLIGSLGQDIYYGTRRGDAVSIDPPTLEFWGDLSTGMFRALQKLPEDKGEAGKIAYKTVVKKVPLFRWLDAKIKGPVWQDDHKPRATRRVSPPSRGRDLR